MSNTFCVLPWTHIYANPNGDVLPCCIADWRTPMGNLQTDSIEDIWNGERFNVLRRQLLANKKPDNCNQCWVQESSGNTSNRMSRNNKFSDEHLEEIKKNTLPDGSLPDINFYYVDIRWSNICNFKCRTCGSTYSSSWAKESASPDIYRFAGGKNNDTLYTQLLPYISNVKEYYFAGGEPLLTDKHYDILDHMISIGNTSVKLDYNTNLSNLKYKNKNVLDYWNQFDDVTVNASIDHHGLKAEYIREGTNWDTIERNIDTIRKECPNVKLSFNTVVSAFNLLTITDFLAYMETLPVDMNHASLYNLVDPVHYTFAALPNNALLDAYDKILDYYRRMEESHLKGQVLGILNTIKNTQYDKNLHIRFRQATVYYDTIRNADFDKTFPEYKKYFTITE